MSQLTAWVQTPAARAIGWTLVHFLWEGAVLDIVLLAVLRVLRRGPARLRYTAACIILAAMPVAFAITLAVLRWMRPAAAAVAVPWTAVPLTNGPIALPAAHFTWAMLVDRLAWLVPVWFGGVAFFYLRGLFGWAAVRRLRNRGVCAAPAGWQDRLDLLARRLAISRPVALLESCLADAPVLVGYLRPAILLPLGCLTGLSTAQVECILLHELAHVVRRDFVVNLLQSLVEGLLFYHPAVWWVSRVVRNERENCCDDRVVELTGDARAYAATLAVLEHRRALLPEAALAATGGNLMKRIRRLTVEPRGGQASLAPAASAAALLVIFAAALSALPVGLPNVRHAASAMRLPRLAMAIAADAPRPAAQQSLPPAYENWLTEDAAYIITRQERADFLALSTDAGRDQFIEKFWERRDPTPGTQENEYKDEHYRRIAYANEHFAATVPGWMTDRGRTYILYGPPDEIDDHPAGTAQSYPYQQWRYRYISGMGTNVLVEFVDQEGNGDYRMTQDPAGKDKAAAPYRKWINEDVAYIISSEERAAFLNLRTDEAREQFIHQFWQSRGEAAKAEHYRRIAYANANFAAGALPGWKTDRGHIYIAYGPPDLIGTFGARTIEWTYRQIAGVGSNVIIDFEDPSGTGDYRMTKDPAAPQGEVQESKARERAAAIQQMATLQKRLVESQARLAAAEDHRDGAAVEEQNRTLQSLREQLAESEQQLAKKQQEMLENRDGQERNQSADEIRRKVEAERMAKVARERSGDRSPEREEQLAKVQQEMLQSQSADEIRQQVEAERMAKVARERSGDRSPETEAQLAEVRAQLAAEDQERDSQAQNLDADRRAIEQREKALAEIAETTRQQSGRGLWVEQVAPGNVVVHVPLNRSGKFHVTGEVRTATGNMVRTFEGDSSNEPAMARPLALPAGNYQLATEIRNTESGAIYLVTLTFTVN